MDGEAQTAIIALWEALFGKPFNLNALLRGCTDDGGVDSQVLKLEDLRRAWAGLEPRDWHDIGFFATSVLCHYSILDQDQFSAKIVPRWVLAAYLLREAHDQVDVDMSIGQDYVLSLVTKTVLLLAHSDRPDRERSRSGKDD
jgi:hypothetical protein